MRKNKSEHSIQSELIKELAPLLRPGVVRLSIPNGGMRHPLVGKFLKEEGLMPGSPDLVFALENGATFWLEMKNRIGRLSDDQLGMAARLERIGHSVGVAHSVEEALEVLYRHGNIARILR